jgi:hypothetical protein
MLLRCQLYTCVRCYSICVTKIYAGVQLFVGMFLTLVSSVVASYKQVFIVYAWVVPKVAVL